MKSKIVLYKKKSLKLFRLVFEKIYPVNNSITIMAINAFEKRVCHNVFPLNRQVQPRSTNFN